MRKDFFSSLTKQCGGVDCVGLKMAIDVNVNHPVRIFADMRFVELHITVSQRKPLQYLFFTSATNCTRFLP